VRIALLLSVLAFAGCVTDSEPYPVTAVANLAPMGSEAAAQIEGPIEILGTPSHDFSQRTLAAYRVHLPDAAPRRVRIYNLDVCDPNAPPPPDTGPVPEQLVIADLQQIRRVGDEAHFFMPGVRVAGRRLDIDTQTVRAELSTTPDIELNYVIGKIAVVQALDRDDGTPGGWLACGVFAEASK
jgi:hypothetical protein